MKQNKSNRVRAPRRYPWERGTPDQIEANHKGGEVRLSAPAEQKLAADIRKVLQENQGE